MTQKKEVKTQHVFFSFCSFLRRTAKNTMCDQKERTPRRKEGLCHVAWSSCGSMLHDHLRRAMSLSPDITDWMPRPFSVLLHLAIQRNQVRTRKGTGGIGTRLRRRPGSKMKERRPVTELENRRDVAIELVAKLSMRIRMTRVKAEVLLEQLQRHGRPFKSETPWKRYYFKSAPVKPRGKSTP